MKAQTVADIGVFRHYTELFQALADKRELQRRSESVADLWLDAPLCEVLEALIGPDFASADFRIKPQVVEVNGVECEKVKPFVPGGFTSLNFVTVTWNDMTNQFGGSTTLYFGTPESAKQVYEALTKPFAEKA